MRSSLWAKGLLSVALAVVVGCAAPAPTATPTIAPAAGPTQAAATATKAPTATPTKRPLTKVTITTSSTSLSFMVPFIGRALGYWEEEGLDVDWVVAGGGAKALAAVVGGSSDFSVNSFAPEVIKAIDAGQKVKAVAVHSQRGAYFMALNKKVAEERRVSQKSPLAERGKALKGLTIAAFSVGGASHQVLKALLQEGNLDPERDLTITFIGNDEALVAALKQGQIDGFLQSVPAPMVSVVAGDAIMLLSVPAGDLPVMGNQAHAGLIAQQATISGRAEVVDGAVRAVWRSQRIFNQDPAATAKALRKLDFYAEIDEQAFNKSIEALPGFVAKEPLITKDQFDDMVKYHNSIVQPNEQTKITVSQFFDDGPGQRAKKQLGL